MQAGHILEAMLSEHARPVFLNRIAGNLPDLPIIGTHAEWPGNRSIGWLRRVLRF
jgi:hypothetical protein